MVAAAGCYVIGVVSGACDALMTSSWCNDRSAEQDLRTLSRRQLGFVLVWAELHQLALLRNWRLARAGEPLHEIDPLR